MDYNYTGIKPESIELLCLNRFNDSRSFYEEHKEELKQGITVPLRQMVLDLSDVLLDIDDEMYLDPVRVHSRIHRDTRRNSGWSSPSSPLPTSTTIWTRRRR